MEADTKAIMEMLAEMKREAKENHQAVTAEIRDNRAIFEEWRPQVEKQVESLQEAVKGIQAQLQGASTSSQETPFRVGELPNEGSPAMPPAPGKFIPSRRRTASPDGRRDDNIPRGPKPGVVTTVTPPAKGTKLGPLEMP